MCKNLEIYNNARQVPDEAQKPIGAGRLKGYTDINPMWRIKKLTELFGVCGIGWYTDIIRTWLDKGEKETVANVEIKLYVKVDGEWSKGISGIGASKFVNQESKGPYDNDECYKCAYTDAMSVACKQLGIGADVYFAKDTDKYSQFANENEQTPIQPKNESKTASNEVITPQINISYEDALNYMIDCKLHFGKTLRDVYKTDRASIEQIYKMGTAKLKRAIEVIEAEIAKARK